MPSTYSSNLRLELMASGENDTTWGTLANQIFNMIEDAISEVAVVTHNNSTSYTLTSADGTADEARCAVLQVIGTLTANRNVVCPATDKTYIIHNATTGGYDITIKTPSGTGVIIPNGARTIVYCDGTNVVSAINQLSSLSLANALPIASGGTGATSASAARAALGLVIGTDVQAYDADLASIAALSTTSYGRGLLTLADAAALRASAGLVIGTDVQAYDADLTSIAALSTTSFGRNLLTLADAAALRSGAGLVIGTDVQAYDADLASIAALSTTSFGRGVLVQADAAAMRSYIGASTGTGDVVGPVSATTDAIALFSDTTGKSIKNSGYTITSFGASLINDASAADARTTLALDGYESDRFYASLSAAAAAAASSGRTLHVTQAHTISSSLSINCPVIVDGGSFSVSSGQTLTFGVTSGVTSTSPTRQIFSGAGSVVLNGVRRAEWFGVVADYNSGTGAGTDNAAALNRAIASGWGTVEIGPGEYAIDDPVTMAPTLSNTIHVRGVGSLVSNATRITCRTSDAAWRVVGSHDFSNLNRLSEWSLTDVAILPGAAPPTYLLEIGSASNTILDGYGLHNRVRALVEGPVLIQNARLIAFEIAARSATDATNITVRVGNGNTFCGDLEFHSGQTVLPDSSNSISLSIQNTDTTTAGAAPAVVEIAGLKFFGVTFYRGDTVLDLLGVGPTATVTGNTTNGSAVVTSLSSTTGLAAGQLIGGAGIGRLTRIASVDSATQITLSQPATATATGVTLTWAKRRLISDLWFDSGCQWDGFSSRMIQAEGRDGAEIDGLSFESTYLNASTNGTAIYLAGTTSSVLFGVVANVSLADLYILNVAGRIIEAQGCENITIRDGRLVDCGAPLARAGTTTNGSPTVTGMDTNDLVAGMTVTGTGIPGGTTIASVNSATQITLSANATASGAVTLTCTAPEYFLFNQCRNFTVEGISSSPRTDPVAWPGLATGVTITGALSRDYTVIHNTLGNTTAINDAVAHSSRSVYGNGGEGGINRDFWPMLNVSSNGLVVRSGAGTSASRTLTAGTGITVTNGDGVAGNPTAAINTGASLTWTGAPFFDGVAQTVRQYGGAAVVEVQRAAGSVGSPSNITAGPLNLSQLRSHAYVDGSYRSTTSIIGVLRASSPTSSNMEGQIDFLACPAGSASLSTAFQISHAEVVFAAGMRPSTDNTLNLGSGSFRLGTLFAGTGTINTSDATEKTALRALSEAERRAARTIMAGIGAYQWLDAVAAKGANHARLHIGVTAQAVRDAFAAEGLDASRYGLFCVDPLFEEVETTPATEGGPAITEQRPVIDPATGQQKQRLGVRADQLMWLALAAIIQESVPERGGGKG